MLRSDLAWKNLQQHFPTTISNLRALDIGGGTGLVSLRLAKAGFQVVLLDSSAEMLAIARKTVEAEGQSVPDHVAFTPERINWAPISKIPPSTSSSATTFSNSSTTRPPRFATSRASWRRMEERPFWSATAPEKF